jgi:hypothetical protein
MRRAAVTMSAILVLCGVALHGQWLNYPDSRIPRLPDGKPNLAAASPRAWDGKPDLSGVWHPETLSREEMQRLLNDNTLGNIAPLGMEPETTSLYARDIAYNSKPGEVVLTPEGQARVREYQTNNPRLTERCLPLGMPRAVMLSEVEKIIQAPGEIVILHELDGGMARQVYTDGRPLPNDPVPSWQGYSIGRWEGDSLIVETIGFNGKSPLDGGRHPRSEAMKITERMHRRDVAHLDVETTFDDPKYYVKPFTVKITYLLQPDTDILEYVCNENEKWIGNAW